MAVRESESLRTRTAAFLFWDTVGSTALLSRLGDERAEEVRRRLFAVVREVVTANRGEEVKNTGDGLMVAFPSSMGDSLSCAVGIQRAVAVLDGQFPEVELAVRVGVAAGDAISDATEDDWFGRAVVTAARLCDAAPTSEIYATSALGEMTNWRVEPVGALTLKGLPDAVETVRVPWTLADGTAITTLPPILQLGEGLPLVGRHDQLAQLDESLERARQGEPARVRITGPIGCGVSRLVREWLHQCGLGAEMLLGASCVDREPFDALAAAIDWHAASAPEGLTEAGSDRLAPLIATVAPSVARLTGVAAAHAPRSEVEAALVSYVRRLADNGPVVVVLDDCAERHHVAMDEIVVELAGRSALMISAGPADVTEPDDIGVAALTTDEVAQLLRSALRLDDDVNTATASLIAEETSGVALQVCEVVNTLARERAQPSTLEEARVAVTSAITLSCPWRGLKALGAADHALFFGRDGLLAELIGAVGRARVTVVSGSSGSGKSSLLAAGLVPALQLGTTDDSELRRPIVITPGREPDRELDELIETHLGGADNGDGAATGAGVVLIVDQLEELWTHGLDDDERNQFIDRLVALGSQEEDEVRVVLGLRSDFLGPAVQHDRLRTVLRDSQILVGTPDVDDLRRMILGPAETTGFILEDGLVERLLSDVAGEIGALPLLSHALYETWRRRQGRTLTLAAYEACGGIEGAIAATAEGVVESMTEAEVDETRHLFNRLITLGEGRADTRRRARTEELTPASRRVAEPFVEARLLSSGEGTIEVSHEALLQYWPRLKGWLSEDRDDLRHLRHLADAAAAWDAADRSPADLYRGSRLEVATEVAERRPAALNESERDFLDAALAQADLIARRERRRRNLMRSAVAGLVVLLVASVVAGAIAAGQSSTARSQAARAEDAAANEQVQRLMAQSRLLQNHQTDVAILLALEAQQRDPSRATGQVLLESLSTVGPLAAVRPVPPGRNPRGASLVADDGLVWRATGDQLTPIDMATGEQSGEVLTPRPDHLVNQVEPLAEGRLAVAYDDGLIQVIDAETDAILSERNLANKPVLVRATANGTLLAVNTLDSDTHFLSLPDLSSIAQLPAQISGVWTSRGDGVIAGGGSVGTSLQRVDADGVQWSVDFESPFRTIAAATGGDLMAGALGDGKIVVWSGDRPDETELIADFDDPRFGTALFFDVDGMLYVGRDDGAIYRLDPRSADEAATPFATIDEEVQTLWVDETGESLSAIGSDGWYRFRLDGLSPLAVRLRTGERGDVLASTDDQFVFGTQPGRVEVRSTEDGALIQSVVVGENGAVSALAQLADSVFAAVVEFRGIDLGQLRSLQDAGGVELQSGLTVPFIYDFQETSIVSLDDDGSERWRIPMDLPVIGLEPMGDGALVVALDVGGSVFVLDAETGRQLQMLGRANPFFGYVLTRAGDDLLAVGGNLSVPLRLVDGTLVAGDDDPLLGTAVSATAEDVVVAESTGVRVVDAANLEASRAEVATDAVVELAQLLSGGKDLIVRFEGGALVLLDLETQLTAPLAAGTPLTIDIEPLPDGGFLTADNAGHVDRWTMDPVEWRQIACELVGRNLSREEWATFFPDDTYRPTC